ncbi:MAG: hypothetical protein K8R68_03935, partial [Bacteroidales bacterium]|nr:hypothetical protein [Bacteroidales bacterium]
MIVICYLHSYAEEYFWIGGNGNWSDINHWAYTSGGSTLHNTPPTADDDVFYDINSFSAINQTVFVDTENAVCRNIDFTGTLYTPTITHSSSGNNLRIFGSITLIPDITFNYGGTITFESISQGNTIQLSGQQFNNKIFFEGIGGEWILTDELNVNGGIYLNYGSLISNDQIINCTGFSSTNTNERILALGNSSIIITGSWSINGTNITFSSGTSKIFISGNLFNNGDALTYNKINFTGISSAIQNSGEYVYYDSVLFQQSGNVTGDCNINYLDFTVNGSILNSDTIKYVKFGDYGTNNIAGSHVIDTAIFMCNGSINGQNLIHYCEIKDSAIIKNNNEINKLFVGDTAMVEGSNQLGYSYFKKMVYFTDSNSAENAYLNCDGKFRGNNTFDTLTFSPGFQYIFENKSTQTINEQWNINGSCEAPIWLKSAYNGDQATISKTNGNVTGTFLSLKDINAEGNMPFQAFQSVDLGNNTNWEIDTMQTKNLFWVNGQGEWTNQNHWDTISGGTGGVCPPTEKDNVFFDANSFTSSNHHVIINTRNAVCCNMDWTGANNPALTGPDTNYLKIYGSLKFINNMSNLFEGETHFEDTLGSKTIESAGKTFKNNVRFQGNSGGWKLLDKFFCSDTIFQTHGWISTSGENIESQYFFIPDTNYKKLSLHTDTVKLYGDSLAWFVNGTNLELYADSSVIITTNIDAIIQSENNDRLVYHNIHQFGSWARIINNAYCVYNLVTHQGVVSSIIGDCTIDTAIFYNDLGSILGSDTIKTVMFYGADGRLSGSSIVEIAYYYNDGFADGNNQIDTALFYAKGNILGSNKIDTTIIYDEAYISGQNIIRTATLKDKGWFYGNNTFNDLALTYAKKYIFGHDSTQTIIDNFNANGRCTGNIILMSDFDGKLATIEKTNGNVEIEYANLRDIKAVGNNPFVANNSVDLGNNPGWEINIAESLALFWVGGTGDWSDSLHWAPTSGGQSGYCIPSPIDDVYFDNNSFNFQNQSVTLDIENATCRNMDWFGSESFNPIFTGLEENEMFIYGSLNFNDSLNPEYLGQTYFESRETGRTIAMHEKSFNNDVVFRGRDGGWSFIDDFSTDMDFHFIHGKLNTNGNSLSCYNLYSADTNIRQVDFDTSTINAGNNIVFNTYNMLIDVDSTIINTGALLKTYYSDSLAKNYYYDTIIYNDVNINGYGSILNDSVYCYFDDIRFFSQGSIHGDCWIDSVVFDHIGDIFDNDSINFAYFKSSGNIIGGEHFIKSAIFDGSGTISGSNEVYSVIFNSNGTISGFNVIDTTIIYGNGNINEDNIFNSVVMIYGNGNIQGDNKFNSLVTIFGGGNIFGNNTFESNLILHGDASIIQNNHIHDALLLEDGVFGGYNTFDILTLTPGKTYTMYSWNTQTINQRFYIRGNNCFPITLQSSTPEVQANIYMPSDTVSGDFINMRDINAT